MRGAVIVSVPTDPEKLSTILTLSGIVMVVGVIYFVVKAIVSHFSREVGQAERSSIAQPTNMRTLAQAEPTESLSRECPFCAETIKAAAIVCRYCGRELPVQQQIDSSVHNAGADLGRGNFTSPAMCISTMVALGCQVSQPTRSSWEITYPSGAVRHVSSPEELKDLVERYVNLRR
jgi:hypothetical protein